MIPFLDLKAQYKSIKPTIDQAIAEVLESSAFALGPAVQRFEARFAEYAGAKHAIAVNSGTSALHLALLALGVGPEHEVICPAMTFVATAAAVHYTGARPVLVDVDPRTYTMAPELVEAAITSRTRVIIPVHLYGQPADMDPILEIARRRGLFVLEDAAQAHGAEYRGRRCGSLADIAAFSFYPGKNLGAYGEGGAVTTDREDLAKTVRALRDWGQETKGVHALMGFNYRMEGIQGAILAVKMDHIEAWTEARQRVALRYQELLTACDAVTLPGVAEGRRHVHHVYALLVANRDRVRQSLTDEGVSTGIHYPLPVHLQPCFAYLGYRRGDFPVAERVAEMELSLPMFPEMTDDQIAHTAQAVRRATHD